MSQPELVLALALTFGALATVLIVKRASARTRAARAFVLAVPAVTIVAMFAIVGSDLRVNFTPSMPLGIYRLEALPLQPNGFARNGHACVCRVRTCSTRPTWVADAATSGPMAHALTIPTSC